MNNNIAGVGVGWEDTGLRLDEDMYVSSIAREK